MTDRERWIMYPLLFLAVGLGLRNSMVAEMRAQDTEQVTADVIRCRTLQVLGAKATSADQNPLVLLSSGGEGQHGLVETFNSDGRRLAAIGATSSGSMLTLLDNQGRNLLLLGHEGQIVGLLFADSKTGRVVPMSVLTAAKVGDGKAEGKAPADGTSAPTEGKSAPADGTAVPAQSSADGKSPAPAQTQPPATDEPAKETK